MANQPVRESAKKVVHHRRLQSHCHHGVAGGVVEVAMDET
jgi:hypothetical protein